MAKNIVRNCVSIAAALLIAAVLLSLTTAGTGGITSAGSKVVVIVNSSIQEAIQPSLEQYVSDLEAEGYSVTIYATEGGTPNDLRTFLQEQLPDGLAGCILIGDLPVPWYEMDDDFYGHAEFPTDLYYMDLDGAWIDSDGNGKYDAHYDGSGDQEPEIWVGRLTASPLSGDEVTLLQNYFAKNHGYRTGELSLNNRALNYVDDTWAYHPEWYQGLECAYRNVTIVQDPATTTASDYKNRLAEDYEWIQVMAHSRSCCQQRFEENGNWSYVYSSDIKSIDAKAFFYNLYSCSACRYVETDYIGGWYVFADSYGLAAIGSTKIGGMRYFSDFYAPLGEGKSLGQSFKEWFIDQSPYGLTERQWFYGMTLLGDPTLKPLAATHLPNLAESLTKEPGQALAQSMSLPIALPDREIDSWDR